MLGQVAEEGLALFAEFAESGLVPDWVDFGSAGWRPSKRLSGLYGYEAMRLPLYLAWSGASPTLPRRVRTPRSPSSPARERRR